TVFTVMRLIPEKDEYIRQVVYIETMNGQHSHKQAVRLKQLYYDFESDYVAMDTSGNGLSLYDDCAKILYDEERDVE
ncbi:MAG: terminase, partial [Candidatus Paceibacterota bacterium]